MDGGKKRRDGREKQNNDNKRQKMDDDDDEKRKKEVRDERSSNNKRQNPDGSTQPRPGPSGRAAAAADAKSKKRCHNPCAEGVKGTLARHEVAPSAHNQNDVLQFFADEQENIISIVNEELERRRGLKWYLCLAVQYVKYDDADRPTTMISYHACKCIVTLDSDDVHEQLLDAYRQIHQGIQGFMREGSGWSVDHVLQLDVNVATYAPITGTSYIKLPKALAYKKAIVNIQNTDDKCFMWSVLGALHPQQQNAERYAKYLPHVNELKFDNIEFPVKLKDVHKFEVQNEISVNVFGYENDVFPLHITTNRRMKKHVNLLMISDGEKSHYCTIKSMSKLLGDRTKHNGQTFYCDYCLHAFCESRLRDEHLPLCRTHEPQKIRFPSEENKWIEFDGFRRQLRLPFLIIGDFESITCKVSTCQNDPLSSSTVKCEKHEPCGFSYVRIGLDEFQSNPPVTYRGANAVERFLECMVREEEQILDKLKRVEPMVLTREDQDTVRNATHCHICSRELGADRVRDHCHITGKFRGMAHNECNLNYQISKRIPVVFHNLRGYDSHLIMSAIGQFKDQEISCIANNMEKYLSFTFGNLVFIDSLQFLNCSLEKLVANLATDGDEKFKILKREFSDEKVPLLTRKGVYPYEYIDSWEKFEEKSLPAKEKFFNQLTEEHISDADYAHAQRVWTTFGIQNLGEYHDLYMLSDVLLLADVFENFRDLCLEYYQLDPCHYCTFPGLSWDACLKMTGVRLELLTDPDMYLFFEQGKRGGVSMISHRYSKANNEYLQNYDPSEPSNYILYLDMNNLYGCAMSMPLPVENFDWLSPEEIKNLDVLAIPDDASRGYMLDVDLEYDPSLHDVHNSYPVCPETLQISSDMLSPYSSELLKRLNLPVGACKLVPNLRDKTNYIIHYVNLKQCLNLGLKLKKIHRGIAFDQSPWLKSYIDFNTEKRKESTDSFSTDLFKLANNAIYGKALEDLRKRVNVTLINEPKKMKRFVARPSFQSFKIFNEDLAAVKMHRVSLLLNKPIYVGCCILDLSKKLMYDFHYGYTVKKYGPKARLLFTDTDSLCYEIETDDVYEDMQADRHLFDFSDYPPTHPLYSTENKKVLGKMKDELKGIPGQESVGLRPKMYSLLHEGGEKKTAKGVTKSVTKKKLKHELYRECLFSSTRVLAQMRQIRSFSHEVYTVVMNKVALSAYDDKRYILDDGQTTLAYGHFKIPK